MTCIGAREKEKDQNVEKGFQNFCKNFRWLTKILSLIKWFVHYLNCSPPTPLKAPTYIFAHKIHDQPISLRVTQPSTAIVVVVVVIGPN